MEGGGGNARVSPRRLWFGSRGDGTATCVSSAKAHSILQRRAIRIAPPTCTPQLSSYPAPDAQPVRFLDPPARQSTTPLTCAPLHHTAHSPPH
eukprot:364233-Chlamydomonas_euryale.AAC.18